MQDPAKNAANVPHLFFLRLLVTVLTITMIIGIVVITTLFIIRFSQPSLAIPTSINLPNNAKPVSFTQSKKWFGVVDDQGQLFIFNLDGILIQTIKINTP